MWRFTDAIILKYCLENLAKVFRCHLNIFLLLLSVLWRFVVPIAVHNAKRFLVKTFRVSSRKNKS